MEAESRKDQLDRATTELKKVVGHLYDLELLASEYPADAPESALGDALGTLVTDYAALDALKDSIDVSVPQDVVEYIEAGRNPNVYTRQFSEAVTRESQNLHGKMTAHKEFAAQLGDLIKLEYPELSRDIESIT
ncbi:protein of unknown function [Taphrina deformans PYCC 5710]|uniref:Mediator of RNA polymerase II transcription subunit 10 n=1 Tax=Taphrina deformans (strain PYCC 5710 / ATCC 11124 / CBS 356.35 / IMI 108563 / JCM 9778 / NBRC 8474) TaxID=1097556 RepID=R4XD24_TAPDE|nr:protein of unknown function [Taphrina deformans PYCC 5710]|eukprot:CCG83714.1 protein of unknown function [Taphrina deformans PYCC 5710]